LEKHPVRRVGGAEGAAENRVRSTEPLTALGQDNGPSPVLLLGVVYIRDKEISIRPTIPAGVQELRGLAHRECSHGPLGLAPAGRIQP
jgi:hypothetical protein